MANIKEHPYKTLALSFAGFIIGILFFSQVDRGDLRKDAPQVETVEVHYPTSTCLGCGATFDIVRGGDGDDEMTDSCPLCPMTQDELDEIIKQIEEQRNRQDD